MTDDTGAVPAHVHVVRGAPDDVELAALVAGLAAVQIADDTGHDATPASAWTDRSHGMRGPRPAPRPGPDAWRWSLRG
jgi:hypothetical protein